MARSRKQRERKLKAKMHELNNKHAAMKRSLSSQSDVLVKYVGGVAEFGDAVLKRIVELSVSTDSSVYHALGINVVNIAHDMNLIKPHPEKGRYELTHCVKENSNAQQATESPAQETDA